MLTTHDTHAARSEALVKAARLIRHFANRYTRDADDLAQDACLLFFRKFQPGLQRFPSRFALLCVKQSFHAEAWRNRRQKRRCKPAPLTPDIDRAAPEPDPSPDEDDVAALRKALAAVLPEQRALLTERFGLYGSESQTLKQISERFGVSKEAVRLWELAALAAVRRSLAVAAQQPNPGSKGGAHHG